MNEDWKKINDGYEVSNLGMVRSVDRMAKHSCGGYARRKGIVLKQGTDSDGYRIVRIYKLTQKVHRLVAKAFIPNPKNHPQVNHINGIKHDNRTMNLEWCDQSHNLKHAFKLGLMQQPQGHNSTLSKIDRVGIIVIREGHAKGIRQSEISKYFNVSRANICNIVACKSYKIYGSI